MLFLNNEEQTSKKKITGWFFFIQLKTTCKNSGTFEKKKHTHTINIQINHTYILGIEMALPWNGGSGERISLTIKGDYFHLHLKRFTVSISLVASYTVSNKQFINKTCLCPGLNASIA